ncbi:EMB2654 [Symbiodinium sp. CCMP2592]|nr:EMB2654 [Symbiodinium sp. CCMP2592]
MTQNLVLGLRAAREKLRAKHVRGHGLFGKGQGALQQELRTAKGELAEKSERLAATEESLKAAEERLQAPDSAQTSNVASEELQHAKKELAEKTERLAATEASLKAAEERLQAPDSAQTSNVASEELQHAKRELAEKTERLAATEASLKAAEERLQAPDSAQTSNVASEELQHAKRELAEKTERLRVTEASLKAAEERRHAAEAQVRVAKATEEVLQERVSTLQRALQVAKGKRQNRLDGIVAKSRAVLDWVAEEDAKGEEDESASSATSATGPDKSAPSKQPAASAPGATADPATSGTGAAGPSAPALFEQTSANAPGPSSDDVSSLFGESSQGAAGASSFFGHTAASASGATADTATSGAGAAGPSASALFEQTSANAPGPSSGDVSSLFGESSQGAAGASSFFGQTAASVSGATANPAASGAGAAGPSAPALFEQTSANAPGPSSGGVSSLFGESSQGAAGASSFFGQTAASVSGATANPATSGAGAAGPSAPALFEQTSANAPGPSSGDVSSLFGESSQGAAGASSFFGQTAASASGATADPATSGAGAAGPSASALFEQTSANAPGPSSGDVSSLFGESSQGAAGASSFFGQTASASGATADPATSGAGAAGPSAPALFEQTSANAPGPSSDDVSSLFGESSQGAAGASSFFGQTAASASGATADPATSGAGAAGPSAPALFEQTSANAPGFLDALHSLSVFASLCWLGTEAAKYQHVDLRAWVNTSMIGFPLEAARQTAWQVSLWCSMSKGDAGSHLFFVGTVQIRAAGASSFFGQTASASGERLYYAGEGLLMFQEMFVLMVGWGWKLQNISTLICDLQDPVLTMCPRSSGKAVKESMGEHINDRILGAAGASSFFGQTASASGATADPATSGAGAAGPSAPALFEQTSANAPGVGGTSIFAPFGQATASAPGGATSNDVSSLFGESTQGVGGTSIFAPFGQATASAPGGATSNDVSSLFGESTQGPDKSNRRPRSMLVAGVSSELVELPPSRPSGKLLPVLQEENDTSAVAEITSLGRSHAWQKALSRLQEGADARASIAAWSSCIKACKSEERWPIAIGLHDAMISSIIQPSVVSYGSTISALAADAQWEWVLKALEDMESRFLQPNLVVLNSAIRSCSEWNVALALLADLPQNLLEADAISFNAAIAACVHNWQVGVEILQQMHEALILQDVVTSTGVIKACGSSIQWQAALEVLDVAHSKGVRLDVQCFNCVLNACAAASRWVYALQLIGAMASMELRPDDVTLGTATSACGKAGRWEHALLLSNLSLNVQRSVFSQTAAVSALAKAAQWALALSSMECMQQLSTPPNHVTVGAVISAFGNAARWDGALSILWESRHALPLTVGCFNAAIQACHLAGRWQHALQVLCQMEPLTPDITSQNIAMNACGLQSQWQRVIDMLEDCRRRELQADELTHRAVLAACSAAAQWSQCLRALAEGPSHPSLVTHTMAIDSLRATAGGWALALALLRDAELRGLEFDTVICNAAINACAGSGQWEAGLALMARMHREQIEQSVATHTSVLTASAVAALWEVALTILGDLRSKSASTARAVYNAALSPLGNTGRWEHALVILNAMQVERVQFDLITCSSAMSACEKGMQWEHALVLFSQLARSNLRADAICYNAAIEACSAAEEWTLVSELMRASLQSADSFTIAAYDHSVQAGSSVDCFKHIVLICLLQRMVRDGDPFLLIDTHAGRGLYDLTQEVPMLRNASKWGVQQLAEAASASDALLDAFVCTQRGFLDRDFQPLPLRFYLGSPAIALQWLRPQDRGLFFELSEPVSAELQSFFDSLASTSKASSVELRCANSYSWILDHLATLSKRSLVFVDPPYEPYDVSMACNLVLLEELLAKEACCAVWYPLLDGVDIAPFYQRIAQLTKVQGDALVVEFGFETSGLTSLQSSGILMTHPPQIDSEVAKSLEAMQLSVHVVVTLEQDESETRWREFQLTVELNNMAEGAVERQASDEALCWICRDPDRAEPLVAPCRCRGSMRGVHASCIESWVAARQEQRMRSEMQGGDSVQPRICCDLCGEPYQAEHQPANLCECLQAHCRSVRSEMRDSRLSARQVLFVMFLSTWLLFVLLASAELVAGVLVQACRKSSCWMASTVLALCLLTLLLEMVVVLVSFPYSGTPPSYTVLRPFHISATDPNTKAVVFLLWLHLWMAPLISAMCGCLIRAASIGPSAAPVAWWLVGILVVPPLMPLVKHSSIALRDFSWQQMASRCATFVQEFQRIGRACCSGRSLERCCSFLRLVSSPSLPWLHVCLAFPFGIAWFCSAPARLRYWVLGLSGGIGCAASAFAWLQLCSKGPQHDDYLCPYEASVRMHAGWFLSLVMLLYAAFSVFAEWHFLPHSKRDPVRANVAVFVVWCVWVSLVTSLAMYANCFMLMGYSQTWRRQHGRVRIAGEALVRV